MAQFHVVSDMHRRLFQVFEDTKTKKKHKFPKDIILPQRSTPLSAGYDFVLVDDIDFLPNQTTIVVTDIKFECADDEFLDIRIRSSLGIKHNLMVANQPAVIDADYFENPDNDGNIMIAIRNLGGITYKAKTGEKIAQGLIMNYKTTIDDSPKISKRLGGIGSTGK